MKHQVRQDQNLFYRSFELDRVKVDEEKRSIEVAFSSETPVKRYFGDEYLLHGKENVDLSRIKRMGAALMNHDPSIIVGPLKNIIIGDDLKGRATIIFDDDEEGNRAMRKVKSGSLKGISVGYRILRARELDRDEEFTLTNGKKVIGPAMLATRWEPYEISLTPIPADASVGVGRSLDGIEIVRENQNKEKSTMKPEEIQALVRETIQAATKDIVTTVRAELAEDAKPKMRISTEVFQDLLGRAGAHSVELKAKIADMAIEGKSEREIVNAILDAATGKADAGDKGNGDGQNGTQMDNERQAPGTVEFKGLEDDDFFRGLSNPGIMTIQ